VNLRRLSISLLVTASVLSLTCLGWIWYAIHPSSPHAAGQFPLQERWHIQLEGRGLVNLVSWNEVIYACLGDRVYAIRPQDGTILWQRHLPTSVGEDEFFIVRYGVVCIVGLPPIELDLDRNRVSVLDAATGEELWQVTDQRDRVVFHLAVGPDAILVSRHYGLTAYDRLTGAVLWRQDGIGSCIWAEGDRVFTDYVVARKARNGDELWTTHIVGRIPSAASGGQEFYVCTTDGTWTALDMEDGRIRWSFKGGILFDPPLVEPDILCGGNWTSALFALNPTNGQLLWQTHGPIPVPLGAGNMVGSPVMLDRTIYVRASEDGRVYALSRDTGDGLGSLETYNYWPLGIHGMVTAGGLLIVPVGDHELYALGPPAASLGRSGDIGGAQ